MALRNLKQIYPDIVYICIGYGEEEENIKDLVKELDLGSQVMFFKDISSELKNSLIAKSNIFVMPSIIHKTSVEGFGIAYVEAAQYGVPSLGGKDGGASDAIDHDKTGLICDGNNLDDIYSSLNSMIENKKYLEFGKNAKEYVSKFQWEKIVEEYKKFLIKIYFFIRVLYICQRTICIVVTNIQIVRVLSHKKFPFEPLLKSNEKKIFLNFKYAQLNHFKTNANIKGGIGKS